MRLLWIDGAWLPMLKNELTMVIYMQIIKVDLLPALVSFGRNGRL